MEKYENLQILNLRRCGKTQRKGYIMKTYVAKKEVKENYYVLINNVLDDLNQMKPGDEGYDEKIETLDKLMSKLNELETNTFCKGIDPNQIIDYASRLIGLAACLNFEKTGCITSKAFGKFLKF